MIGVSRLSGMSSQQYQPRPSAQEPQQTHAADQVSGRVAAAWDAYDSILDEIDAVLEKDAEAFVRGFVQKGGQ